MLNWEFIACKYKNEKLHEPVRDQIILNCYLLQYH